jgi:hypothetical protein
LSLYGWNLVGLTALVHYRNFPQRLHGTSIILLHWVTVSLLAPLGYEFTIFAIAAVVVFIFLTRVLLFSRPEQALPQ